ncbi:hypothetical protein NFI96_018614 [Prochilodus magdalenae]|nr:hypothetical protein NFI96_018614 [Prochilodus magdalenae]
MKMALILHCSAAILVLMLLYSPSEQGSEARPSVTCCLGVSEKKIPVTQLMYYTIQERPLCPVRAVRFRTQKDNTICSNPTSRWAIRAMDFLDKKNSPKQTKPTSHPVTTQRVQSNNTTANGTSSLA